MERARMPACLSALPEAYAPTFSLDLQRDRRTALLVNGLALLLAVPLFLIGAAIVPISALFSAGLPALPALLGGFVLYMALHELIHGACMKAFGAGRVRYGFTGLYAYAGSEAFFRKGPYIVVALAPVVLLGAVLLGLNFAAGPTWFWVVYFIQVCNISGAAGDLYVVCRFSRLPSDILVQDTGVAMTVYARRSGARGSSQRPPDAGERRGRAAR